VSADDKVPVENLPIRIPFFVKPDLGLLEMLAMFREGRCHLALVTEDPTAAMKCMQEGKRPTENCMVIGIVTLEDVIEEILQGNFSDYDHCRILSRFFDNFSLRQIDKVWKAFS
jgi:CBS domain containing-hemolysin-like protein